MLWEVFAAGETGALLTIDGIMNEGRSLCRNFEASSQNIRQEVKAWGANVSSDGQ